MVLFVLESKLKYMKIGFLINPEVELTWQAAEPLMGHFAQFWLQGWLLF